MRLTTDKIGGEIFPFALDGHTVNKSLDSCQFPVEPDKGEDVAGKYEMLTGNK